MLDAVATSDVSHISSNKDHFFRLLHKQVELTPSNIALIYEHQRITYAHLLQRVSAIAYQLQQAGIKKGEKVGILFPNHPDYVASFFAAAGLGATIVPINPLLKSDEIAHILADSHASTLVVHENSLAEALKSQQSKPVLKRILVSTTQSTEELNEISSGSGSSNIKIEALSQDKKPVTAVRWCEQINPEQDLALLVYTSGTTGKPKGAMLTHRNMLAIFPARLDLFDIDHQDKTLATLPMCHIYGITILMLGNLSRGASLVLLPRFEAVAALKLIQDEQITLVPAVPAMYQFMLMELEKNQYDLSAVRLCFSGAAPLPLETIKQIEKSFGAILIEGYGLTESSCVATINPLHGERKVGSIGPVVPGVQMHAVSDDGSELPCGAENVGEFWIKGPNVLQGYYGQPEASAECIQDGWFATGDLGYKDEDGYFFIVGRKKEMIIRGGANIYPREIEDVLMQMDEVADAAVVGVPDKFMGERVKAVVVLKSGCSLTEDEIRNYCGERLAEYKVPRIIEFSDLLPRNSTGKVLKRLLIDTSK